MEKQGQKLIRIIGLLAALLLTFGITYLDFDDLSMRNNIKPYIEIAVGLYFAGYFFFIKRKYRDG